MEIETFFSLYTDAVTIKKDARRKGKEKTRKKNAFRFRLFKRLLHARSSHPVTNPLERKG